MTTDCAIAPMKNDLFDSIGVFKSLVTNQDVSHERCLEALQVVLEAMAIARHRRDTHLAVTIGELRSLLSRTPKARSYGVISVDRTVWTLTKVAEFPYPRQSPLGVLLIHIEAGLGIVESLRTISGEQILIANRGLSEHLRGNPVLCRRGSNQIQAALDLANSIIREPSTRLLAQEFTLTNRRELHHDGLLNLICILRAEVVFNEYLESTGV